MPLFRYDGPDPVPGDDGEIVRPGQVAEMDGPPDWGPWTELSDEDGGPELSQDAQEALAPATAPAPSGKSPRTATPPAAGNESKGA